MILRVIVEEKGATDYDEGVSDDRERIKFYWRPWIGYRWCWRRNRQAIVDAEGEIVWNQCCNYVNEIMNTKKNKNKTFKSIKMPWLVLSHLTNHYIQTTTKNKSFVKCPWRFHVGFLRELETLYENVMSNRPLSDISEVLLLRGSCHLVLTSGYFRQL